MRSSDVLVTSMIPKNKAREIKKMENRAQKGQGVIMSNDGEEV